MLWFVSWHTLNPTTPVDLSQVDDKDDDDCLVPSYPYPLFQNEEDRLRKSLAMKPNQAIFWALERPSSQRSHVRWMIDTIWIHLQKKWVNGSCPAMSTGSTWDYTTYITTQQFSLWDMNWWNCLDQAFFHGNVKTFDDWVWQLSEISEFCSRRFE